MHTHMYAYICMLGWVDGGRQACLPISWSLNTVFMDLLQGWLIYCLLFPPLILPFEFSILASDF